MELKFKKKIIAKKLSWDSLANNHATQLEIHLLRYMIIKNHSNTVDQSYIRRLNLIEQADNFPLIDQWL